MDVASPRSVTELLERSPLTPETQELIRTVVMRARLWPSERFDVTEELIAHFADGLEAGMTERELLDEFGDGEVTAALIRRARVRQRSTLWHGARAALLAAAALVVFASGAYVYRAASLHGSSPLGWRAAASDDAAHAVQSLRLRYESATADIEALRAVVQEPVSRQRLESYRRLTTPAERASYLSAAWSLAELEVVEPAADRLVVDALTALQQGNEQVFFDDVVALTRMRHQFSALETPGGDLAALHVEGELLRLSEERDLGQLGGTREPWSKLSGTRRYFALLLDSLYGEDGQLTAEGIEIVREMKGWHTPSRLDRWMEPGWYLFPASRLEATEGFSSLVAAAELGTGTHPPAEDLETLLRSTWRCLRNPALSAVGAPLYRLLRQGWETSHLRRRDRPEPLLSNAVPSV